MNEQNSSQIVKYNPLMFYPDLTTQDIEKSTMPEFSKQIALASLNNPKIKQLNQSEVKDSLIETLGICIWESGFNIDKEEQKLFINYAIEVIRVDYSSLTLEEIKIAVLRGVRGKYGDVMGMNIRMLCKWIDTYIEEEKVPVIRQLGTIKKEEQKEKQVTDEEKKYWRSVWLLRCLEAFETYKSSGQNTFLDLNNALYNFIRYEMRLVDLTEEEVNDIWSRAKVLYKQEHSPENARNLGQKVQFKAVLERLALQDKSENENIKNRARKIALTNLFGKMKLANIDFKARIIEHEKYDFIEYIKEYEGNRNNNNNQNKNK